MYSIIASGLSSCLEQSTATSSAPITSGTSVRHHWSNVPAMLAARLLGYRVVTQVDDVQDGRGYERDIGSRPCLGSGRAPGRWVAPPKAMRVAQPAPRAGPPAHC